MRKIKILTVIFTLLFIANACGTKKKMVSTNPNFSYYGEKITADNYVSFPDMMKILESKGEFSGKVKGKVVDVCQKKGCWMTLNSGNETDDVFVKFKDYGFFMPFDLGGSTVVVRGTAKKEITSVKMLRHYAMDGGATKEEAEKITEPETSFRFMADGVVVVERK